MFCPQLCENLQRMVDKYTEEKERGLDDEALAAQWVKIEEKYGELLDAVRSCAFRKTVFGIVLISHCLVLFALAERRLGQWEDDLWSLQLCRRQMAAEARQGHGQRKVGSESKRQRHERQGHSRCD